MIGYSSKVSKLVKASVTSTLVMSLLAGCVPTEKKNAPASSGAAPAASQENVELRFSWWGSQGRHDRTLKLIDKFQQLHPNIKIKPEYTSFDGYWEKLSTQVAANNAPDLMQMSILYIKEYSDRGVLADLTPYLGKDVHIDDLNKDVLKNQGTINGKLTGLPVSDNASVMIYNKEMYKQAGIEPPKNDMTWKEYFDKAREIKSKLGDKVYGSFDLSTSLEGFMYYSFSVGDTLYNNNKLGYKDETLTNWLKMWDDARKEGLVPPAASTASFLPIGNADPNKDALMKGVVPIMGPQFTATFPAYENVMKDKIDMITYPKDKKTGSVLETAMFLSASAKSKHPKEAAMFLDFFLNSKEAADILETDRGLPENKKMLEYLTPKFTERDKKMVKMLEYVSGIQPAWYDAGPKGAGEVTKLFEQTVQKQQFGKVTIDAAVAEFRKEADKIFEKNNN
ncbi:sugar ABC transporter substrate-binding protein [Paenibacillus filicis]|uniref:Sugar ABC transporter substrate-binding protein n=1 Tax=Paenibacillus gyeongsangnamensis TaxID=3388067 RepID=A0ABT4QKF1_9BACL|nr:sugar ABC transporter substrate-binding protein [Paenibacillus filicis]MCZ8517359.1 sugar ABC transporter substrate-binding protein [Paenibacillus filicis]